MIQCHILVLLMLALSSQAATHSSSGVAEGSGKITSFFARKGAGTTSRQPSAQPAQPARCDAVYAFEFGVLLFAIS